MDGLISDSTFVGLPGNITFFTGKGNLTAFPFKLAQALAAAGGPGDAAVQEDAAGVPPGRLRLRRAAEARRPQRQGDLGRPHRRRVQVRRRQGNHDLLFRRLLSRERSEFHGGAVRPALPAGLEEASLFGNAVVAIRGHADPGLFVQRFLDGATRRGLLKHSGFGENYTSKDGKPFDLNNIKNVLDMIDQNPGLRYRGAQGGGLLRDAETSLEDLSQKRAETVRQSIVDYATKQGLVLDKSQIRFQGVGVKEPVFANPQSDMQNAKNRAWNSASSKCRPTRCRPTSSACELVRRL